MYLRDGSAQTILRARGGGGRGMEKGKRGNTEKTKKKSHVRQNADKQTERQRSADKSLQFVSIFS